MLSSRFSRLMLVVFVAAGPLEGCLPTNLPYDCCTAFARPTMTPDPISSDEEVRVHANSEASANKLARDIGPTSCCFN